MTINIIPVILDACIIHPGRKIGDDLVITSLLSSSTCSLTSGMLAAKFLPPAPAGEPNFTRSFLFDSTGATFRLNRAQAANFLYHDCSAANVLFAKENF